MSEDSQQDNPQPESSEDGREQKPDVPQDEKEGQSSSASDEQPRLEDLDDDVDDEDWRRDAQVINEFNAPVHAPGALFGIAPSTSSGRATGRLSAETIARTLRCYIEPSPFGDAERILRDKHLVVLAGRDQIGKRAGAIALLRRVTAKEAKIIILSPALSLTELTSDTNFRPGNGYLLQDWVEDISAAAIQRFEVERLLRRLGRAVKGGSYLVITMAAPARRRHFESLLVEWAPPDPIELFEACLARIDSVLPEQSEIDKVRVRARELLSPADVIRLAERVPKGAEAALGALEDSVNAEVTAWFDEKPKRHEVLAVVALAFVHGVPERTFESLLSHLIDISDEIKWGEGREARPSSAVEDLPQDRAAWSHGHALVSGSYDDPAETGLLSGERRLVFRFEGHREQVIAELFARYGYELWEPLRIWAGGLATSTPEVRVQVACGAALLARRSLHEVEESFLGPWSHGVALERLAAAHVLSWMCVGNATAPTALRIALRWVKNSGQRPAITAAVALGGELGVRYPTDCLNWLWFLSLRAERISEVARRSLSLLFRMAVDRGDHATTVLRLLLKLAGDEVGKGPGSARTRTALTTVVRILDADRLDSTEPLVASLLLANPENAELLGGLWACALRSRPHRTAAINALRRSLRALEGEDEALDAVARLGAGVWSSLPPEWVTLVKREVSYALLDRADQSNAQQTRKLAAVLLAAVETVQR